VKISNVGLLRQIAIQKIIALIAQVCYVTPMKVAMLLALGLSVAHAAEPTGTVMLACEGTKTPSGLKTPDSKPESVSMGMNFDFKAQTIYGLSFEFRRIVISQVTETTITFDGSNEDKEHAVHGIINRVTGVLQAKEAIRTMVFGYSLKCKPTQRMF
jgi:hypothetical protein